MTSTLVFCECNKPRNSTLIRSGGCKSSQYMFYSNTYVLSKDLGITTYNREIAGVFLLALVKENIARKLAQPAK